MANQVTPQVTQRGERRRSYGASVSYRELAGGRESWRVTFRQAGAGGVAVQRVQTFHTATAADRFAREIRLHGPTTALALDAARADDQADTPLLGDWMRDHVRLLGDEIGVGTRRTYLRLIKADIDTVPMGSFPITGIMRQMAQEWSDDYLRAERQLGPKSIHNRTGLLWVPLSRAVDEELIPARGQGGANRVRDGLNGHKRRQPATFAAPTQLWKRKLHVRGFRWRTSTSSKGRT